MRTLKRTVGVVLAVALFQGTDGVVADDAAEVRLLRAEVTRLRARIRLLETQLAALKARGPSGTAPEAKELASPEALMATAPAEPDYSGMTGGQKKAVQKAHAKALEKWQQKYRGKTVHWTLIVDDVRLEKGPSGPAGAKAVCLVAHSAAGTTMEVKFPPAQTARLRTIRKQQVVKITCRIHTCHAHRAKGEAWSLEGIACDRVDEPASRPADPVPGPKTTDTRPADPAAGPEALLAKAPAEPDCDGMTTAQTQAARAAHAEAMKKWQNACRGKTVRWTVTVDDVSTEKRRSYRSGSGGIVAVHVRAHSAGGSKVYLTFPPQHAGRLMKMQNHEIIRVTGRIVAYTLTGPRVGWSLQGIGFQEVKPPATKPAETASG